MRTTVLLIALAVMSPEGGSYRSEQAQPPRDTRNTAPAAAGRIAGVITTDEATPQPLRRARVFLSGPALEMPRGTITGDDGSFVFEGVPPGRFGVGAEKPGYMRMNYGAARPNRPGTGVQLADRQTVRVALRLPRGAVITGTVTDVDGQPAAGVSVTALTRRYSGDETEFSYTNAGVSSGPTDDRGVYRIYGLAAGDYLVAAQPVQSRPTPVRMMSAGTLGKRSMLLAQVYHPGVSDAERASRVTLQAGEERGGIDVQLEYVPLATLTGTTNLPGDRETTWLWRMGQKGRPWISNPGIEDGPAPGTFRFREVPPGQYRIFAFTISEAEEGAPAPHGPISDAHYVFADVAVNGEDIDVALTAVPLISLAGRIVFEGDRPPPPLPTQVVLELPPFVQFAAGWPIPPVVVDGARFRIDWILPRAYRGLPAAPGIRTSVGGWWLTSFTAGGREMLDAPFELRQSVDDAVATFRDHASEVTGRVLDATNTPVTEIPVLVFSVDPATWFVNSRRVAAVSPNRDGRYTVSNLPPGDYRIIAADLDPNEWFDPAVLERLLPRATPLRIAGTETQTIDLTWRWQ